jgi:hypothetical protein
MRILGLQLSICIRSLIDLTNMMNPIMETFFLPHRSNMIPIYEAKTKAAISGALSNSILINIISYPNMMESFSSVI